MDLWKIMYYVFSLLLFIEICLPVNICGQTFFRKDKYELENINLFDFGENPAGLSEARIKDYLQFETYSDNLWGNNKRSYDPEGQHKNTFGFSGVTKLNEKSTFYGESSYLFDLRSNQNKSLKYDTYSGEPFFTTDSTKGNILYHGPQISFIYNYEIIPGLFSGIKFNYGLMDGLKSNYSQAQTLLRKISGRFGLAYAFSNNFTLGTTIDYYDMQESIDITGNEQYMVDIYNFRGDSHSILNRTTEYNEKGKKRGEAIGIQLIQNTGKYELGFLGEYSSFGTRDLLTKLEEENGFTNINYYKAEFDINYDFSDNTYLCNKIKYLYSQSWSKHSLLNLLLWKWNVLDLSYCTGITYKVNKSDFVLGINYALNYLKSDSAKYIDRKYRDFGNLNHYLTASANYEVFSNILIRNIIEVDKLNIDPLTGKENFWTYSLTLGSVFQFSEKVHTSFNVNYLSSNNLNKDLSRSNFNFSMSIMIVK